jgi:DNA-binding NarL/FixJ family response regulator
VDLTICFIDDSDFEHDLVRREIAPSNPGLTFIQAYSFDEARDLLGKTIPLLFLLDLWGADPVVKNPELVPRAELEERISGFHGLDFVFEGLDDLQTDPINPFLKRLFMIVDSWRTLFEDVCQRAGQNRKYGLSNLQSVRQFYPGIPAVFYTRKSLIQDAVAVFQAGAEGFLIKPTGNDDRETRSLTREYGPKLTEELAGIIDTHIDQIGISPHNYPGDNPSESSDLRELISCWKEFRNK